MHKYAYLLFVLLSSTPAFADDNLNDFAFGITVNLEQNQLYEFEVTEEMYRHIQSTRLHDVRIFRPNGNVMPANIIQPETVIQDVKRREENLIIFPVTDDPETPQQDLNLRVERNTGGIIVNIQSDAPGKINNISPYYVADLGENYDKTLRYLSVDWNHQNDKITNIRILASNDLKTWNTVGESPVFFLKKDNHILSQQQIKVDEVKRYLKIVIAENNGVILKGAKVVYESTQKENIKPHWTKANFIDANNRNYFYEVPIGFPVRSVKVIPAGQHVIQYVRVNSGANKKAMTRQYDGNVYRLSVGDIPHDQESITLRQVTHHPYWEISVQASNQKDNNTPALELGWQPHKVRFLSADKGEYTIAFGSASVNFQGLTIPASINSKNATVNTIALPKGKITLGGNEALREKTGAESTTRFILWIVLALVLIVMGYMTFRLMKHMKIADE